MVFESLSKECIKNVESHSKVKHFFTSNKIAPTLTPFLHALPRLCLSDTNCGFPYTCEVRHFLFWKMHFSEDTTLKAHIFHKNVKKPMI